MFLFLPRPPLAVRHAGPARVWIVRFAAVEIAFGGGMDHGPKTADSRPRQQEEAPLSRDREGPRRQRAGRTRAVSVPQTHSPRATTAGGCPQGWTTSCHRCVRFSLYHTAEAQDEEQLSWKPSKSGCVMRAGFLGAWTDRQRAGTWRELGRKNLTSLSLILNSLGSPGLLTGGKSRRRPR